MPLSVKKVDNKKDWERLVNSYNFPPFLQSWSAGEMHRQLGDKFFRLGLYRDNLLVGGSLVVKIMAKRGSFLYCPYGPILNWSANDEVNYFFRELKRLAEKEKVVFVRVSPFLEDTEINRQIFTALGYRLAPIHMLAENLWFLDLNQTEEELMAGMRKTTRNLVRRAIKDGVVVQQRTDSEAVEAFIELHQETVKRQHFVPYKADYFRQQVQQFAKDNQVAVFLAEHGGELLSAAIIMYYGKQGAYHHGASVQTKVPASYLLQWEAVKEAKKRGLESYNFWGIVPKEKSKGHPWAGLSLFKMGFGGYQYNLIHCQDLELRPGYYINYLIERYRKWRRGL